MPADEDGKGRRRGELDEGRGGEKGAGEWGPGERGAGGRCVGERRPGDWGAALFAASCHEDQRRQEEEAHRVEVGAPGGFDDQQR